MERTQGSATKILSTKIRRTSGFNIFHQGHWLEVKEENSCNEWNVLPRGGWMVFGRGKLCCTSACSPPSLPSFPAKAGWAEKSGDTLPASCLFTHQITAAIEMIPIRSEKSPKWKSGQILQGNVLDKNLQTFPIEGLPNAQVTYDAHKK